MDSDNRILSQLNSHLTNYSAYDTSFVPIVNGSFRKGIARSRKELWVEDNKDPYYRRVGIGSLPDDALLEIFEFFVDDPEHEVSYRIQNEFDVWHTLVHVCQKWRNVVFSSPRRLNLQLLCIYRGRPVREVVNLWPELPIVIIQQYYEESLDDVENFINIPALKLNDRVSRISLWDIPSSALEVCATAMQVPFPALTDLAIWWHEWGKAAAPILSDEFMGGSAPRLQYLSLRGIAFPALGKLLLSTAVLVTLILEDIPHSGYISPEEMVTCFGELTQLKVLSLEFRSPLSRPSKENRLPRPPVRTILPALTQLVFKGVTEYLEDLVARIDVPLLDYINITFFNQLIFDILQLRRLIFHADTFAALDRADVRFEDKLIGVTFSTQSRMVDSARLILSISCTKLDWQLSSLPQVCPSILCSLSHLESLDIRESQHSSSRPKWQDDVENSQWLELLQPFTSVKSLYLSKEVVPHIAPALEELVGERVIEVLPALQVLFLDEPRSSEPVSKAIRGFVVARSLSGHPVDIQRGGKRTKET